MRDKRKYIKNTFTGKKSKAWNKLTKPFPNNIAKFGKGSYLYYNQGKWINKHEYGKGRYYNEYYNNDPDLVKTDKRSCSRLESGSHSDSVLYEMFFAKEKNILVSLEKYQLFLIPSLFASSAIIQFG